MLTGVRMESRTILEEGAPRVTENVIVCDAKESLNHIDLYQEQKFLRIQPKIAKRILLLSPWLKEVEEERQICILFLMKC